jgi:hypothetical protein
MKTKILTLAFFALLISTMSHASCQIQAEEDIRYPKIDLSISK